MRVTLFRLPTCTVTAPISHLALEFDRQIARAVALKVLVGCEFGGGGGHAVFAASVTRILHALHPACQVEIHVSDAHSLAGVNRSQEAWRPLPRFLQQPFSSKARSNFGHMVFEALCGEAGSWDARLRHWDRVFTDFKPDVVLAEYSPGLSMFARGRVATVVTGTGYSIPPTDLQCFPELYEGGAAGTLTDAQCVETLNHGLRGVGAKPLAFLPQINAGDLVALVTLPLFDPYWDVRKELYLGAEVPNGFPKPGPDTSRILAYFGNATVPESTWTELGAINRPIEVYCSGKPPKQVPANVTMRERPFDLKNDLPGADLAIHLGGLGFASAAVLAGVRQLVLYGHDEHWVQARAVEFAKIGSGLQRDAVQAGQIREVAEQLLGDQGCKGFALALAKQYAPFAEARPSERIAKEILRRA